MVVEPGKHVRGGADDRDVRLAPAGHLGAVDIDFDDLEAVIEAPERQRRVQSGSDRQYNVAVLPQGMTGGEILA